MKKVLSTKTLPNEAIAHARRLNIEVHCLDFIETRAAKRNNAPIADSDFDAVAFTSSNAVKYFLLQPQTLALLTGVPVFSIDGKTLSELKRIAIRPTLTAKNALALADAIIENKSATSVLHVCGDIKLDALESKLTKGNIAYTPFIVYNTTLRPTQVTTTFNAIMFYSPTGVESYCTNNNIDPATICCCIGETTAMALQQKNKSAVIIVSPEPSPTAMIDALDNYFKTY